MGDGPRDWRNRTATNVGIPQGSVYHRSDGRWVAQLEVDGKRRYLYAKTRADARQRLRDAIRDLEDGRPHAAADKSLSELLDAFLDTKRGARAPTTVETYERSIARALWALGDTQIRELNAASIEKAYAKLRNRFAPDTVRGVHAVLRGAISAALRWGWLPRDPLAGVPSPPPGRPRQNPLSADEGARLLDETTIDRYHALWHLMATTGMTIGEACGLSWRHVDLNQGTVSIERLLSMLRGVPTLRDATKTKSRRRRVTLSADTVAALKAHRARQLEERLQHEAGWNKDQLVFCNESGRPVSNHAARVAFKDGLQRANLPDIRMQDLRHTAATLLLQANVHLKVVSERLGHSSITITANRYSHVMEAQHREADQKIDDLLSLRQQATPQAVSSAVNPVRRPPESGAS
jgi:integrase